MRSLEGDAESRKCLIRPRQYLVSARERIQSAESRVNRVSTLPTDYMQKGSRLRCSDDLPNDCGAYRFPQARSGNTRDETSPAQTLAGRDGSGAGCLQCERIEVPDTWQSFAGKDCQRETGLITTSDQGGE
jgi:hypothetical protein